MAVALCASGLLLACSDDSTSPHDPDPDPVHDAGADDSGAPLADSGARDASEPEPAEDGGLDGDAGREDAGLVDSAYYPLSDGASWVYRHSGGASDWDENVALEASEYEGAPAFRLTDTPGPSGKHSESVLTQVGNRVSRVYRDEYAGGALSLIAEYDPGFIRFDYAWTTRTAGFSEVISYSRVERDAQGTITAEGTRSHRYTVEAIAETITVPAGELHDCIRIRRERVRAAGVAAVEGDDDRFWFCPGIGKAREEDQVTLKKEELVSCDIPDGGCPN